MKIGIRVWLRSVIEMQFYIKKICHILLCNNRKKNPLSHAYLMSKSFSLKFYNSFTSRCESGLGREASLGFVEKLCKSVHAYCIHSAYCILHTQCNILHIIHRVHRCTNAGIHITNREWVIEVVPPLWWWKWGSWEKFWVQGSLQWEEFVVWGVGGGLHVVGVGVGLYLSGGRDSWKST